MLKEQPDSTCGSNASIWPCAAAASREFIPMVQVTSKLEERLVPIVVLWPL